MQNFGSELRKMRIAAGRTLKDVADALGGVSVPYVSDIERGRRNPPPPEKIRHLAQLFGQPEAADRLAELAIKDRGEIAMTAKNAETRELLVALNRSIETESLDRRAIEEIRRILQERARPKD